MLSNYGYEDGSGSYYIQIDTDRCCDCEDKPCIGACPEGLFERLLDDYDEEVVQIREDERNRLRLKCVVCKNRENRENAPACIAACPHGAIRHTW